jgi:hypothetical protein
MGFGWTVHAFDASPPKRPSAEALMLWGPQDPVVPVRTVEWSGIGADSAWGPTGISRSRLSGFQLGQP